MFAIYHCPKCWSKLDKLALRSLWKRQKWRKIIREHYGVLNYALASDGDDLKWFFVFHRIQCYCGWKSTAVHRMRFELNPDLPVLQKDLQLIHIDGAVFYPIDGLFLGRRVKGLIAAFLERWNRLADLIIICTPFISSKFTYGEWEWLMEHTSPFKFRIITRPQSYGLFKRLPIFRKQKIEEIIVGHPEEDFFETIEKRVIRPIWAEDAIIRYQKFHAKFFTGIFSDHAEVIHSSFNLFKYEEKQLENVAVEVYSRDLFFYKFLRPFGIEKLTAPPDTALEKVDKVGCVICSEKNGSFASKYDSYKTRSWQIVLNFFSRS